MDVQRPYDFMMMGHWHQYITARGIICNGSSKEYDEYAAQCNFDFEMPTQAAWLTHPDLGDYSEMADFLEPPGKVFKSVSMFERAA